jgi:hypothetical protein
LELKVLLGLTAKDKGFHIQTILALIKLDNIVFNNLPIPIAFLEHDRASF